MPSPLTVIMTLLIVWNCLLNMKHHHDLILFTLDINIKSIYVKPTPPFPFLRDIAWHLESSVACTAT